MLRFREPIIAEMVGKSPRINYSYFPSKGAMSSLEASQQKNLALRSVFTS